MLQPGGRKLAELRRELGVPARVVDHVVLVGVRREGVADRRGRGDALRALRVLVLDVVPLDRVLDGRRRVPAALAEADAQGLIDGVDALHAVAGGEARRVRRLLRLDARVRLLEGRELGVGVDGWIRPSAYIWRLPHLVNLPPMRRSRASTHSGFGSPFSRARGPWIQLAPASTVTPLPRGACFMRPPTRSVPSRMIKSMFALVRLLPAAMPAMPAPMMRTSVVTSAVGTEPPVGKATVGAGEGGGDSVTLTGAVSMVSTVTGALVVLKKVEAAVGVANAVVRVDTAASAAELDGVRISKLRRALPGVMSNETSVALTPTSLATFSLMSSCIVRVKSLTSPATTTDIVTGVGGEM